MIATHDITGMVLAGGQGLRMGGADKGLQLLDGVPLALRALQRLSPQVSALLVNANRNTDTYARFGVPVC
ncbi:MAG: NTP transferase domain-containing protein, partial [Giesbergeria sp.]